MMGLYQENEVAPRKDDDLDELIEEIITDAHGDEEQFDAFCQAFEDQIEFPVEVSVLGEGISVTAVDYDGNHGRGITVEVPPA